MLGGPNFDFSREDEGAATALLGRCERYFADDLAGLASPATPLRFPPHMAGEMVGFSVVVPTIAGHYPTDRAWHEPLVGTGTSLSGAVAAVRAMCEALERYCSVAYPPVARIA